MLWRWQPSLRVRRGRACRRWTRALLWGSRSLQLFKLPPSLGCMFAELHCFHWQFLLHGPFRGMVFHRCNMFLFRETPCNVIFIARSRSFLFPAAWFVIVPSPPLNWFRGVLFVNTNIMKHNTCRVVCESIVFNLDASVEILVGCTRQAVGST